MARTDVPTTARRIRRQLGSTHRQEEVVLAAGISDSDTTVSFTSTLPAGLAPGVVIGCEFELMRVQSINTTSNTAVVLRGYHDSDAAAHSINTLVELSPRFSLLDIYDAMRSEIETWSPELFYIGQSLITAGTDETLIELPIAAAGALRVLDVLQSETSGDATVWPRIKAKEIRTDATEFGASASGIFLRLLEPVRTGSLYVTYALPFTGSLMTTTADLVTDVLLQPSMIDLLEMGVKRRVFLQSEFGRSARQAQDEPRRAEENPAGSTLSFHQLQQALYTRRRTEEANRLRRLFPLRMN